MLGLLISFFSSFFATLLIIRYKHLHQNYSSDWDLSGPQKFHTNIVPRIGGISIVIGLFTSILIRLKSNINPGIEIILLISAVPTFAIGLTEDLTKIISIRLRLIFTAISAAFAVYLLPVQILGIDIPLIDLLFSIPFFGLILTVFAITGLANAYNIIDGFNGLASMVAMITLLTLAYVSFLVADPLLMYLSLIMAGSILGVFIWNYPQGLIFLGDGGAYLIGFWIAVLSVMLINRHDAISPWFALLINAYPIVETIFSIYRRKIHQNKSPGHPDGIHFHSLIYRRILKGNLIANNSGFLSANAKTSPYLWMLTCLAAVPATFSRQSTPLLIAEFFMFIFIYLYIYKKMVTFKTPNWLLTLS